jgi:choline dehydrogenase-like flavoprotein
MPFPSDVREKTEFDYIVVGSGAGGGPLAARLALAGYSVLILEAGSNQAALEPTDGPREVTEVPAFNAVSTEHPDLSWQFFVKHYEKDPFGKDEKWNPPAGMPDNDPEKRGIFYPRAAALGGCTVHNAMITIAGPDSDWDDLADFLRDDSWRAATMRPYFQRLERNEYRGRPKPPPRGGWRRVWDNVRWLFGYGPDYTGGRHGFDGWLRTSMTDLRIGLKDWELIFMLWAAFKSAKHRGIVPIFTLLYRIARGRAKQTVDPNDAQTQAESPAGLALVPLAVCGKDTPASDGTSPSLHKRGHRSGPREFLLETQAALKKRARELETAPDRAGKRIGRIEIATEHFVTSLIFEDELAQASAGTGEQPPAAKAQEEPRVVGVRFLRGKKLYHAHPDYQKSPQPEERAVFVKRTGEVILAGGAFNTPQLLMLSGIGNREELQALQIKCRHHSPGVGLNLHDRYEVSVLSEMKKDFKILEGAEFRLPLDPAKPDEVLRLWREKGTGLYTSNGAVLAVLKRSRPELAQPDLFIFGLPLPFEGYQVGYSDVHTKYPNGQFRHLFTWAILKAHTHNHDGTVKLRSRNPLETPKINFHSFREVSHPKGSEDDPDLAALVDGVKFVRDIARRAGFVKSEFYPGLAKVPLEDEQAMRDWIRQVTWGHHACGTCRMGPEGDENAVLDSRFRVLGEAVKEGVQRPIIGGLRVVDASIFPKIPGYFIVTNIYVASEKAADVIIEDAKSSLELYSHGDKRAYPPELRKKEAAAILERREHVAACPPDGREATETEPNRLGPQPPLEGDQWADNVTGLGLSGGGVRSATLNLGIIQALARVRRLRHIDFLSTVSGGGYIGSFLGRFFDHLRDSPLSTEGRRRSVYPAPARIEQELIDPESKEIEWLRKSGNYISPAGTGDARFNLAVLLRNLLSVHFVVGVLIFALFGLANGMRYGYFDKVHTIFGLLLPGKGDLPLGHLLHAGLGVFWSPWFVLFELVLLFLVLPRIAGYWMASQDDHERYQWPGLLLVLVLGAVLLFLGIMNGIQLGPLLLGFALLTSFIHVELAWRRGRIREEAVGTGGVSTQRLRTRNYLTYDLGLGLGIAGVALVFALIDTLGHGLHQWSVNNESYTMAFARFGAILAGLIPIARMAANYISKDKKKGPPSTLGRLFKKEIMAGLLALVLFTVPLVLYSFASHAAYQGGSAVRIGVAVTVFALFISWILSRPAALPFVNRSSLSQTYAGRLARAYLGASNPQRHHPQGANIEEVMSDDDVSDIRNYRPHEAGGPLHLINVTINQTVDFTSQRGNRDRKGENMAVSSIGLSVGTKWHSFWSEATEPALSAEGAGIVARVTAEKIVINQTGELSAALIELAHKPAEGIYVYCLADYARSRGSQQRLPKAIVVKGQRIEKGDVLAVRSSCGQGHRARMLPVGWPPGTDHPLLDETGAPAECAEALSLRQWMSISGAAVGPGRGQNTQLGTALLFGLANLRTGYWWDSSVSESARDGFPKLSFLRRLLYLLPRAFLTQSLLISECIARYPGPWEKFWYISDGGFFENLAGYELIRRRVPRMIICDGGADPTYEFGDFANLVRKARIDFDADIEPFEFQEGNDPRVPAGVRQHLGSLADLKPPMDADGNITGPSKAHAALFWVRYKTGPARPSLLLYIKASLSGNESADVVNYHVTHPEFPHESTGDQIFEEDQWESYRQLGEQIASEVFSDPAWFWSVPLDA